jgi:hypothetical protein
MNGDAVPRRLDAARPACVVVSWRLFRQECGETGEADQVVQVGEGEDLTVGAHEELPHVFGTDTETTTVDAGDDFETGLTSQSRGGWWHPEPVHVRALVTTRQVSTGPRSREDDLDFLQIWRTSVASLLPTSLKSLDATDTVATVGAYLARRGG